MDTVIRSLAVYAFLLVVFRIAGKRAMSSMNTFDFVVLLIISESTQNALVGDDTSLTTCFVVVATLVGAGLVMGALKQWSHRADAIIDGLPVVVVDEGKVLHDRLKKLGIDESDIAESAHVQNGLTGLDEVRFAILERDGTISIIPRR